MLAGDLEGLTVLGRVRPPGIYFRSRAAEEAKNGSECRRYSPCQESIHSVTTMRIFQGSWAKTQTYPNILVSEAYEMKLLPLPVQARLRRRIDVLHCSGNSRSSTPASNKHKTLHRPRN